MSCEYLEVTRGIVKFHVNIEGRNHKGNRKNELHSSKEHINTHKPR